MFRGCLRRGEEPVGQARTDLDLECRGNSPSLPPYSHTSQWSRDLGQPSPADSYVTDAHREAGVRDVLRESDGQEATHVHAGFPFPGPRCLQRDSTQDKHFT